MRLDSISLSNWEGDLESLLLFYYLLSARIRVWENKSILYGSRNGRQGLCQRLALTPTGYWRRGVLSRWFRSDKSSQWGSALVELTGVISDSHWWQQATRAIPQQTFLWGNKLDSLGLALKLSGLFKFFWWLTRRRRETGGKSTFNPPKPNTHWVDNEQLYICTFIHTYIQTDRQS